MIDELEWIERTSFLVVQVVPKQEKKIVIYIYYLSFQSINCTLPTFVDLIPYKGKVMRNSIKFHGTEQFSEPVFTTVKSRYITYLLR